MTGSTDRLVQGVAILAIVVLLALTAYRLRDMAARWGAPASTYKVGEAIDVPKKLVAPARHTVLIYARSTCPACEASRPVMRQIVDAVRQRPGVRVQLLDVIGAGEPELRMAAEIGLRPEDVVDVSKDRVKISAVPTFIVMDTRRVGEFVHVGVPDDAKVKELLAVLDK